MGGAVCARNMQSVLFFQFCNTPTEYLGQQWMLNLVNPL